jgi:hypothetical protein
VGWPAFPSAIRGQQLARPTRAWGERRRKDSIGAGPRSISRGYIAPTARTTPATAATRRGGSLPTSQNCCRGPLRSPRASIDPTSAMTSTSDISPDALSNVIGHERAFAALFDHLLGERRGETGRRLLAYGRLNQIYVIASAQRQFKMKNRASGNTSRYPDPTIVAVDDRFTDR